MAGRREGRRESGNDQSGCNNCDSKITFGIEGKPDSSIKCGVAAGSSADNGQHLDTS